MGDILNYNANEFYYKGKGTVMNVHRLERFSEKTYNRWNIVKLDRIQSYCDYRKKILEKIDGEEKAHIQ